MTARDPREFEPTHKLTLVGDPEMDDEVRATTPALEAVFDHADSVTVWLNEELLGSDHPDLLASFRDALESTDDGRFHGPVDAAIDPLMDLHTIGSFHRSLSLERLDAFDDENVLLRYVPDHGVFCLDASRSPGLAEDVSDAIKDEPAALLPAETIVEWEGADGTEYELSPPHLCIDGSGCFGLGALTGVQVDEERREIRLNWAESGGLLGRVVSLVVPDRPERFRFDSPQQFEAIASAFRPLTLALEET